MPRKTAKGKRKSKGLNYWAKRTCKFIWEDDSALSWIVNIILAFILIKFIVYPGLGFMFQTTHPIVAVVSGSMEHKITYDPSSIGDYRLCSTYLEERQPVDFDKYWIICGLWYEEHGIEKTDFEDFSFHNGFNTGDIMVLAGKESSELEVGDVIVFKDIRPGRSDPIIHRIVNIKQQDGKYLFQTKGDHNQASSGFETDITEDRVIGKALLRVPFLGYIKIAFVKLIQLIRGLFV